MSDKEIQELKERIYAISYSGFPLDSFFNDIEQNDNPRFNKDLAYKDLKLIIDEIYDLREKAKKYDEKETPKKPLRFKDKFYISSPKCPICKTIPHTGNQKYCDECGQKLDWSD